MVTACEGLLDLDLPDDWTGPPIAAPVRFTDEPTEDTGVVTTLGLHRLSAAEEVLRAATDVTVTIVTSDPAELMPLARLVIGDFDSLLRQTFPAKAVPPLKIVYGPAPADDMTESATKAEHGRIVARAEGFGAGHAVATASGRRRT